MKMRGFVGKILTLVQRGVQFLQARWFVPPPAATTHPAQTLSSDQEATSKRPLADVIHLDERRKSPAKFVELAEDDSLAEEPIENYVHQTRLTREGRIVATLAFLVFAIAVGMLVPFEWPVSGTLIATSTSETKTHLFPGGSKVSLGARSKLRHGVGGNPHHVSLLEGEAFFDLVASTMPFQVSTFLIEATVVGDAKVTIWIDTTVSLFVHEGVVTVTDPKAGPAKVILKRGEHYRVPVNGLAPAVAIASTNEQRAHRFASTEPASSSVARESMPLRVTRSGVHRSYVLRPRYGAKRSVPTWVGVSRAWSKRVDGAAKDLA